MPEIPEPGQPPALENLRTEAVAELAAESEAPEAVPFKISFETYKEEECQITGLKPKNAAITLKVLRDIGVHLFEGTGIVSCSPLIDETKFIRNFGDYGNLYRSLADDIEVWELKCVRENRRQPDKAYDFRLYYYILGPERTFYVLAVRQDHYNTDHS